VERVAAAALVSLAAAPVFATPASAEPPWPPAASAAIRPGAQMVTETGQCTSNFVFYDASSVYLGFAAHCATRPSDTASDETSCARPSLPLGTPVEIEGAVAPGKLAYSAWETMERIHEEDPDACGYNDFAVVALSPADAKRVNPTVPHWNGPVALRSTAVRPGEKLLSYGNSGLRGGIEELKPREGYQTDQYGGGWRHVGLYVTPGIFGDSGSGVMDAAGSAVGVLVTLALLPPGANGATDLSHALAYARAHSPLTDVALATGTEAFSGPKLGPGFTPPPPPERPAPPPPPPPSPPPPSSTAEPAAASYRIAVDRRGFVTRLGPLRPRRHPYPRDAVAAFGEPTSTRRARGECRLYWSRLALRATFTSSGAVDDMCRDGRLQTAVVRSRAWRTWKGVRAGTRSARVPELHKGAKRRGDSWVLATQRVFGSKPSPTVSARLHDGRVAALSLWVGAAGG
jgi:hypothetical protein